MQQQVHTPHATQDAQPARPHRRRPSRLEVFFIRLLPMVFALTIVFTQYRIYIPGKLSWLLYYHAYFFNVLYLLFTMVWVFQLPLRNRFVSAYSFALAYNCVPTALFFLLVFAQRQPIAAAFLFDFMIIVFALLRFSTVSKSEDIRKRARQLNRAYRATVCLFILLMIVPTSLSVFKYRMMSSIDEITIQVSQDDAKAAMEKITAVNNKQVIYAKHKEMFSKLSDWNDLDTEARVSALAEVVEMECAVHGIQSANVSIKVRDTEQGLLGYYAHDERMIVISTSVMHDSTPDRALNTTLHEFYHLFQRSVCTLIEKSVGWDSPLAAIRIFDEARQWKANFDLYLNTENAGFEAYESQPVEVSSR